MGRTTAITRGLLLLFVAWTCLGHEQGDAAGPDTAERADLVEKVGTVLPGDLNFLEADATPRRLGELLTKPAILTLIFYRCTGECSVVLDNLATALRDVPGQAGVDYTVLVVSFDESDTPETARRKKESMLEVLGPAWPAEALHVLTGDRQSIATLLAATGVQVVRRADDFVHPTALIFTAPGGAIMRYLHGSQYLPSEIALALAEAKAGRPGFSVRRLAGLCAGGDPVSRRRGMNVLRGAGVGLTLALLGLLAVMLGVGRRSKG
jgi:protein SCO1